MYFLLWLPTRRDTTALLIPLPVGHACGLAAHRGRAVRACIQDEQDRPVLAWSDAAAGHRNYPFAGQIGAFGILRNRHVFALPAARIVAPEITITASCTGFAPACKMAVAPIRTFKPET